jgi:hypothetical protein
VDSGWSMRRSLGWFATFGVVLYNNGPAMNASLVVQGIHNDQVISKAEEDFASVPANSFFVYGGTVIDLKSKNDTLEVVANATQGDTDAIDVDLSVKATAPRGKSYQNVPVAITNNGTRTMPEDSAIYVAILDSNGKIVSGTDSFTSVPIPAGQTVRDVIADVPTGPDGTTALAYVDLLNADPMFN